jgi:transcriptional regulator of met regulon
MKRAMLLLGLIPVELIAQKSRTDVGPAVQPQTGTSSIEGSVLNSITREPIRKTLVSLNGTTNLSATTDASGHFAFRQLPEGRYMIQARNDDYPVSQATFSNTMRNLSL